MRYKNVISDKKFKQSNCIHSFLSLRSKHITSTLIAKHFQSEIGRNILIFSKIYLKYNTYSRHRQGISRIIENIQQQPQQKQMEKANQARIMQQNHKQEQDIWRLYTCNCCENHVETIYHCTDCDVSVKIFVKFSYIAFTSFGFSVH